MYEEQEHFTEVFSSSGSLLTCLYLWMCCILFACVCTCVGVHVCACAHHPYVRSPPSPQLPTPTSMPLKSLLAGHIPTCQGATPPGRPQSLIENKPVTFHLSSCGLSLESAGFSDSSSRSKPLSSLWALVPPGPTSSPLLILPRKQLSRQQCLHHLSKWPLPAPSPPPRSPPWAHRGPPDLSPEKQI